MDVIDLPLAPFLAGLRAFFRLLALLAFVPWPNPRAVPHSARVILALLLVPITWLPGSESSAVPATPEDFALGIGGDVLLGAAFGMTVRIVLAGAAAGASIAGLSMGLTLSAVADPDTGQRRDPVSRIYEWLAVALLLATGLHRRMLLQLAEVVRLDLRPSVAGFAWLVTTGGQVLEIGLRLAAPALGVLLLADLLVGVAGRLLPRMQTLAVAHPLKLLAGLGIMALALPVSARIIVDHLHAVPASWTHLVAAR